MYLIDIQVDRFEGRTKMQCFTYVVPVKKANAQLIKSQAFENYSCGPRGARTHDPNIKSVVLPKPQKASPFDATN